METQEGRPVPDTTYRHERVEAYLRLRLPGRGGREESVEKECHTHLRRPPTGIAGVDDCESRPSSITKNRDVSQVLK